MRMYESTSITCPNNKASSMYVYVNKIICTHSIRVDNYIYAYIYIYIYIYIWFYIDYDCCKYVPFNSLLIVVKVEKDQKLLST